MNVLWLTSGLGCDGDSLAMTSATNPSIEDLLRGCLPGHAAGDPPQPVLAFENGDEFVRAFDGAAEGRLDPFILVLEGSVPNEEINGEGHWAGIGTDPETGQPILTNTWIDRLAPQAAAVMALGHLRRLRRHPGDAQQPHRARWGFATTWAGTGSRAPGSRSSTFRAARSSRTTSPRRCCTSCCTWPTWDRRWIWMSRAARRRSSGGRSTRAVIGPDWPRRASSPTQPRRRPVPGQARLQRPRGQVQRAGPRLDQRDRRLPQRGRDLHGLHDARLPRQVHAVHGARPGRARLRPHASRWPTVRWPNTSATGGSAAAWTSSPTWRRRGAELTSGYRCR